jgi:hypothetical protein
VVLTVNLEFVRKVVGASRIGGGAIVCRAANEYPLTDRFRALPVTALG